MTLPAPPAPPSSDSVLDSLCAMFPDINRDVMATLLSYQDGDADRAAAALLASADNEVAAAAEVDAAIAAQIALDIDQQAALSLQRELDAEAAAARRTQAWNISVVDKAKDMMNRVRSARLTPRLAPSSERHARLLDHDGDFAASDSGPVESPFLVYEAPALPRAAVPTADVPTADVQSPATTPTEEERYASRVGRARAANQASRRASATRAAAPEASPQPAPAIVPVAELI